ncbi:putative sterile alpha motif domain, mitochondrial import inner membrane translocase subunit TIM22 [Helianthus annuus]|nr:putative sterile alpha motif domain, mitochondrial import inner membrane translocase subunit TIM22 [Helianthus annuus]
MIFFSLQTKAGTSQLRDFVFYIATTGSGLQGGPLIHARNYAVISGVNAGISSVLKRLRGKEDVQTSMVAAFGSGVMFSLVSGSGNSHANVITTGVFFALCEGVLFKVSRIFIRPRGEDVMYNETRAMLSSLGLEKYEKNFKIGLLTDNTLPQLTDKALQDIKIPPGSRHVILDHVQRSKEEKKGGRRT